MKIQPKEATKLLTSQQLEENISCTAVVMCRIETSGRVVFTIAPSLSLSNSTTSVALRHISSVLRASPDTAATWDTDANFARHQQTLRYPEIPHLNIYTLISKNGSSLATFVEETLAKITNDFALPCEQLAV